MQTAPPPPVYDPMRPLVATGNSRATLQQGWQHTPQASPDVINQQNLTGWTLPDTIFKSLAPLATSGSVLNGTRLDRPRMARTNVSPWFAQLEQRERPQLSIMEEIMRALQAQLQANNTVPLYTE